MTEKKKRETAVAQLFEQHVDDEGRIVLDRPLTLDEARAQDADNRERYLAERERRFRPPSRERLQELLP